LKDAPSVSDCPSMSATSMASAKSSNSPAHSRSCRFTSGLSAVVTSRRHRWAFARKSSASMAEPPITSPPLWICNGHKCELVHFPPYGHRPYACSGLKAAAAAGPRRTRRGSGSAPAAHSWCAQIIDLEAQRAERRARETAKGQVDDIRPDTAVSRCPARHRARQNTRKGHRGAGSSGGSAPEPTNTRATEPEREPAPARDARL
jgi:hypothetical protein